MWQPQASIEPCANCDALPFALEILWEYTGISMLCLTWLVGRPQNPHFWFGTLALVPVPEPGPLPASVFAWPRAAVNAQAAKPVSASIGQVEAQPSRLSSSRSYTGVPSQLNAAPTTHGVHPGSRAKYLFQSVCHALSCGVV